MAGNLEITVDQQSVRQAINAVEQLHPRRRRQQFVRAVNASITPIKKAAKAKFVPHASSRRSTSSSPQSITGLLKYSLDQKTKMFASGNVFAIVGPRKRVKGTGMIGRKSTRVQIPMEKTFGIERWRARKGGRLNPYNVVKKGGKSYLEMNRVPSWYAHLVEGGHKLPRGGGMVKPHKFIEPAINSTQTQVGSLLVSNLTDTLNKQIASLAKP